MQMKGIVGFVGALGLGALLVVTGCVSNDTAGKVGGRRMEGEMVRFGRVAASVPVRDVDRALTFYRDTLGFEVGFTNGNPVSFAVITQGEAEMHLAKRPEAAGMFHAHLMVDDVDMVYQTLLDKGFQVRQKPKVQEWGLRDIVVMDPDGNTLEIAEKVK
jgi:catechol 2,3-dioxygenase-like lactoylglutathione lyase family enzyme